MLVPVLVDRQRCDAATTEAVKNMMLMNPPSALSVRGLLQALMAAIVQLRNQVIILHQAHGRQTRALHVA